MGLLIKVPRKNMERMEEYVVDFNYQAHQQFLSDSPWKHKSLMDQVARDVSNCIGGNDAALVFDETYFKKQGKKSVGVARQWNGRMGKVDNSQVGVFGVLANGANSSIVDYRLYLPAEWIDDPVRCKKAGIPERNQVFKTKSELVLEMIDEAKANDLKFGWVLTDGGYGKEPQFLRELDNRELQFASDVHKDQRIFIKEPQIHIHETKRKGQPVIRYKSTDQSIRMDNFFKAIPESLWEDFELRDTTRGKIKVNAFSQRVWLWDGKESNARQWLAVSVKYKDTGDTKYFLTNAEMGHPLREILLNHAQRFWVERVFEDAKGSVGMADYQVRGWLAWHHHMALVSLAMFFLLKERVIHNQEIELLSCNDLIELLSVYLPRPDATAEEVVRNIERRHQKRRAAIESARRRAEQEKSSISLC